MCIQGLNIRDVLLGKEIEESNYAADFKVKRNLATLLT